MVLDGGGGGGPAVDVDTTALRDVADRVYAAVRDLSTTHEDARDAALDAFGAAVPPSDLQNAIGFCWGRWSQVLLDAENGLRFCSTVAANAAESFDRTDRGLVL